MHSNNDNDHGDSGGHWQQKPLPLKRIMMENSGNIGRQNSRASPLSSKSATADKENRPDGNSLRLPDPLRCKLGSQNSIGDVSEADWVASEAMSSTLAIPAPPNASSGSSDEPHLFSAPNLSSISLLVNVSGGRSAPPTPTEPMLFRTPKRRDEATAEFIMQQHGRRDFAASSGSTPSTGTSGSPGSAMRTPSSRGSAGPLGSSGKSAGSGIRWNPFDSHYSSELLHLPTLSPSVFATVSSPSMEETSSSGRFWCIEQQAELFPVPISEDSPLKQSILMHGHSATEEGRTQQQLELYFQNHHDITSPPDLPPTGPLVPPSPNTSSSSYCQPDPGKNSKWTQTMLSFPPQLPPHVEQVLKQYMLFSEPPDELQPNNLSNSTLRRKLFNGDIFSDTEDNDGSPPSPASSEPENQQYQEVTPGKVLHTPVMARPGYGGTTSAQWSSSPVRTRHRTSFSPSGEVNSPMFSPITRDRQADGNPCFEDSVDNADDDISIQKEHSGTGTDKDCTVDLYQTAEYMEATEANSLMLMDTDSGTAWECAHSRQDVAINSQNSSASTTAAAWAESNSAGGWSMSTLPTQEEEGEASSRADTGYSTNCNTNQHITTNQEDSVQASTQDMDSGMTSSHQPGDLTTSVVLPVPHPHPANHVLVSYHGSDCSNDISVGFPLGSSTPSKK